MVTWDVKITKVNLADKTAVVRATRTDDAVTPADVWSYTISGGISFDASSGRTKSQIRDEAVDIIWQVWQNELARRSNVAALKSDVESGIAAAFSAKETS